MKRQINNLSELLIEKTRINQQQKELEKLIATNWNDLKESLRPKNLIMDSIESMMKEKIEKDQKSDLFLKNLLKYSLSSVVKWLIELVGEKLIHLFNKKSTEATEKKTE
jgi:hypothetical protein